MAHPPNGSARKLAVASPNSTPHVVQVNREPGMIHPGSYLRCDDRPYPSLVRHKFLVLPHVIDGTENESSGENNFLNQE